MKNMNTKLKHRKSVDFTNALQIVLFVVFCLGSSIAWGEILIPSQTPPPGDQQWRLDGNSSLRIDCGTTYTIVAQKKGKNYDYNYTITSSRSDCPITITLNTNGIQNNATLYVYEGGTSGTLKATWVNGTDLSSSVLVAGGTVTLRFDENNTSNTNENFKVTIYQECCPTCTEPTLSLSSTSGTLTIGDTFNLAGIITTNSPGTLTYSSSNSSVASVAANGTITANASGNATITVTAPASGIYCQRTATYNVTVQKNCYQTINMATNTYTIDCGKTYCFYDHGGANANYGNNENYTATFTSEGNITINFESFATESSTSCYNWDYMLAYDGDVSTGTLLFRGQTGCNTNALNIGRNYTATSGIMTVVWKSDGSNVAAGWSATITATGCLATLTYDAETNCTGTASNEPAAVSRAIGSTIQISNQRPMCSSGLTFVGWTTNSNGTGTVYQSGDDYTITGNATLYAKYINCSDINLSISAEGDAVKGSEIIRDTIYYNVCKLSSDGEITLKYNLTDNTNVSSCKWYVNAHDGNAPTSATYAALTNYTFTPHLETGHDISLVVTKTGGCVYYASARIRVSAGLTPTDATPDAGEICVGGATEITVGSHANSSTIEVENEPIAVTGALGQGELTFIPDGPSCAASLGQCYESTVTFYDFDESATITSADDLNFVRINMEHSFIGDMQIKLVCPTGLSAIILQDYFQTSSGGLDDDTYSWPYRRIGIYGNFAEFVNSAAASGGCTQGGAYSYSGIYYIVNEFLGYVVYDGTSYSLTSDANAATNFPVATNFYNVFRAVSSAIPNQDDFCATDGEYEVYYKFVGYNNFAESYNGGVSYSGTPKYTTLNGHSYRYFSNQNYYDYRLFQAPIGFGNPNLADGSSLCESSSNASGTGFDYCWSNNPNYSYAAGSGYVYEPVNHQEGDIIDDIVKPSNITNMTQIYHPYQSFSNLIGCPLNGTWKIQVCDSWEGDNGYIFNWELSLNGLAPNNWDYTIELADVDVETNEIVTATSTPNVFNIHPTEANASAIIGVQQSGSISLIDNFGCVSEGVPFTYTVTQPVVPNAINETICLGESVSLVATNGSTSTATPFTYSWTDSENTLSATDAQTVTATPMTTTAYSLTITDANGCSGSVIPTVNVNTPVEQEDGNYYLWVGKGVNPTYWGNADNWAKYNYSTTRYENVTSAPTSADNVYVIGNGSCTTTSPTLNVDGAAKNLKIGNGFTVNGGSHNLSIAGNLDMNATNSFIPATGKVSFIGNNNQAVNKAITFYDVEFNQNSVNIITAPSMTINHNATFTKGIVNNDVSFIANSTVTNANTLTQDSYVDGTVTKTTGSTVAETFTFPTGGDLTNDPTNFVLGTVKTEIPKNQEVSVKFNHKSDPTGFTTAEMPKWWGASSMCSAEINGSDDLIRIDHASNAEFWNVTTPVTLSNVTMTAYSEDGDILQFNENTQDHNASSIVGTVYNSSYSCWQNMGGTATVSSVTRSGQYNKISLSGLTIPAGGGEFTTFGSINGNTILPIELKDFYAECNGTNVTSVEWATETEHDNDYFILERSHDAKNFTEIARIQGAGYSTSEKFYQYIDNEIYSGDNYYRLIQVDFDGVKTASEIITIKCNETFGNPNVEAYPNPFNNEITVILENFDNIPAQIEVFDILGKLIITEKIESTRNEYITTYDFNNLAPATYNMRVSTSEFVIMKQIIKK